MDGRPASFDVAGAGAVWAALAMKVKPKDYSKVLLISRAALNEMSAIAAEEMARERSAPRAAASASKTRTKARRPRDE